MTSFITRKEYVHRVFTAPEAPVTGGTQDSHGAGSVSEGMTVANASGSVRIVRANAVMAAPPRDTRRGPE